MTTRHPLLKLLATGSDAALFSPEAWLLRLPADVALAQWFASQLINEWKIIAPVTRTEAYYHTWAKNYVLSYQGGAHIWAHTLRVLGNASHLALQANVDPEIAYIIALFHDLGKPEELAEAKATHEQIGAKLARQQLGAYFSKPHVELISSVVAKKVPADNPYALMLRDADKLDKIGATGIARRLSSDYGVQYMGLALRRLKEDLAHYRAPIYPFAKELATSKKAFTEQFIKLVAE